MPRIWLRGRVVVEEGVWEQGLVEVVGDRIAGVWDLAREPGPGPYRRAAAAGLLPAGGGTLAVEGVPVTWVDAGDGYICPGFLDLHVHGGGGADFMDADPEAVVTICRFHARHGTTGLLATTLTAPEEAICAAIAAARRAPTWSGLLGSGGDAPGAGRAGALGAGGAAESPGAGAGPGGWCPGARVLGFHVEGPFIHPDYRGAQDPRHIRPPDVAEASRWLEAGPPPGEAAWQVTLAPEQPGALDLVRYLRERGVLVNAGHTGCTYAQMAAAVAAGVSGVTHAFNAMRGLHHREPGTVGAALVLPGLVTELIADGHHVAPAAMRVLVRCRGPEGVILITDAMRAAGQPEGRYRLGELEVEVRGGMAVLAGGQSLAGSLLTLDQAVANLHRLAGVPLHQAVQMASLNPARRLGVAHRKGRLAPGMDADLCVLDRDLRCVLTLVGGRVAHDDR